MKLKTKFQDEDFDLGEVVEANVYYGGNGRIKVIVEPAKGGMITFYFESLKGLNEMFEDYEEPKKYWFIDFNGEVKEFELLGFEWQGWMKEIGNYFETREEAEKAVEKLKAWKRLEDKGLRFERWGIGGEYGNTITFSDYIEYNDETRADLDLLFGGEK